jgi:hypothetical protein
MQNVKNPGGQAGASRKTGNGESGNANMPKQAGPVNGIMAAALRYAEKGWPVFPCSVDKKPRVSDWPHKATVDAEQITAWWRKWPDASIGCPTGPGGNGCFVLDVDLPDGPATLARLEAEHGPLPATLRQRTGSGGLQLFFIYPESGEIRNSAGKIGPGLDIRGAGGYVILPPSNHPSGGQYKWEASHE